VFKKTLGNLGCQAPSVLFRSPRDAHGATTEGRVEEQTGCDIEVSPERGGRRERCLTIEAPGHPQPRHFILLNREFRGFLIIFDDICPPEQLEAVLARGAAAVRRRYWWQVCRSVVAFSRQILQGGLLVRELVRKLGF